MNPAHINTSRFIGQVDSEKMPEACKDRESLEKKQEKALI